MTAVIIFYILLFLLALGYVVVNCFHFIRFRLLFRGDRFLTLLSFYLIVIVSIIIGSIFLAILAYNI